MSSRNLRMQISGIQDRSVGIINYSKKMKEYNFYVYILANKRNGILYVGITNNILTRILQHKQKLKKECFTAKYGVDKLVYYEIYGYIQDAIAREKQVKVWKRKWKIELIEEENPTWRDLFYDMI